MRIDGVTTCVGDYYAARLERTLPAWINSLDSVTIVSDAATAPRFDGQARVIATDRFTAHGALFNKGAALNAGLSLILVGPAEWVISFDADTEPPANWREIAEPLLSYGHFYGCPRNPTHMECKLPYGYFQLWHARDPRGQSFSELYLDAGGYDREFLLRWPREHRVMLPFVVRNHGESCKYWCGPGTTPEQQREAMRRSHVRRRSNRQSI